ncbi:MAG: hypothetical protein FJ403_18340 [Verrucomicrobia bacterium]|nr:hypothetical protein [Verrucomicrobiota bacterium]
MNQGPLIFLGALLALAASWCGMVVVPNVQIGRQQQVAAGPSNSRYPAIPSGEAQRGRDVYRAQGCFYCHTTNVRQSGAKFDVVLASAGTNKAALASGLRAARPGLTPAEVSQIMEQAPKPVLQGLTRAEAETALKHLTVPDAKAEIILVPTGPDIERGWGRRMSVAQDYLFDQPLMLSKQRIGPDLTTIAARQRDPSWHLLHLYNPQSKVNGSTMPPYRFLFEKRKIGRHPSPDALQLTGEDAVEPGYEVVPTERARALVAYLLSMDAQFGLFEAPLPVEPKRPDATTNQPSATAPTNAAPTNR